MRLWALILLAWLAVPAWAHVHDSVCDVFCPPNGGSGTLVGVTRDGRGLVISAAHVFVGGNRNAIVCTFPKTGQKCRAKMLGQDSAHDIAALSIAAPKGIETPPRVVAARKEDGPFTCVGFPWNSHGNLRWVRGDFAGYATGGESAWDSDMLHTRTHVISGYSGGARFNRHGEYVGPVSGMTGDGPRLDRTWGVSGKALEAFVGRWLKCE